MVWDLDDDDSRDRSDIPDDGPGWFICSDCGEDFYLGDICRCHEPDDETGAAA